MNVKLIVGCGNPGIEYTDTRHNLGFKCIDFISNTFKIPLNIEKKKAIFGKKNITKSQSVVLLNPQTFSVHIGEAVLYIASFLKVQIKDIFVIFDDIHSSFGQIGLFETSESFVHSAIKSLNESLISDDFIKCAVGIGPLPEGKLEEDFYLESFSESEEALKKIYQKVYQKALDFININPLESSNKL